MKHLFFAFLLITNFQIVNIFSQGSCPKMFIEAKYKRQYYSEGQDLSFQYSLIGLPVKALIEEDRYSEGNESEVFTFQNTANLRIKNALEPICEAIRENDIILLNERHNRPEHRVLLYSILDSLKTLGINSIFLETLAYVNDDSAYHKDNSIQLSGLYTRENVYNQVCHKLKRLNYNVYSYEIGPLNQIDTQRIGTKLYLVNKADDKWQPIEIDSLILNKYFSKNDFIQREAEQAIHIYQKIIRNNIRKAFIYCGYSHLYKSYDFMAGLLQHLLRKSVFSIDQMYLNEHSDKKYENPLYIEFASAHTPFVIVDSNNKIIHSIRHPIYKYITDSLIDMSIGTPRAIYIHNRPTWLELGGDRIRRSLSKFIDVNKYQTDFLVTIYENEEYEKDKFNAIPEDVFQVELQSADYDVILTPNKEYRLFIIKDSQILIDKIITSNE